MNPAHLLILGLFVTFATIGGLAIYYGSPEVQKKYNPDNK